MGSLSRAVRTPAADPDASLGAAPYLRPCGARAIHPRAIFCGGSIAAPSAANPCRAPPLCRADFFSAATVAHSTWCPLSGGVSPKGRVTIFASANPTRVPHNAAVAHSTWCSLSGEAGLAQQKRFHSTNPCGSQRRQHRSDRGVIRAALSAMQLNRGGWMGWERVDSLGTVDDVRFLTTASMNSRAKKLTSAIKTAGKRPKTVGVTLEKYVIPPVLSTVATFFLATHLKPDLSVYFATGEVLTYPVNDKANKLRTVLLDWSDEKGPRVVSATDVTFRSAKDVKWRTNHGPAWISKYVIENDGWATANHITIGIGIPPGAEVLRLVASSNLTILSDKTVQTSDSYPPYRKIEIERLARSEQGVLTVVTACLCGALRRSKTADSDLFVATSKPSKGYSPVLFLSSQEGSARIVAPLEMKEAFALEKGLFPTSISGYWASTIDVANDSPAPNLGPVTEMYLKMYLDDDGKQVEYALKLP